jgi:hypothetical protein
MYCVSHYARGRRLKIHETKLDSSDNQSNLERMERMKGWMELDGKQRMPCKRILFEK